MRRNSLGKVFRSKEEWREIMDRFRGSGLSRADFCQLEGLSLTTFQKWQERLSQGGGRFVELSAPVKSKCWELELDLGDGRIFRWRG